MENPLVAIERMLRTTPAYKLADKIGVSPQYLSMVINGKKPIGPKILEFLGYEKSITYRKNGKTNGR